MENAEALKPSLTVKIAANSADLAMVMAVRAAVFLAEEDNITYQDEFNGNDYAGTHLLALVDGDPAGVIRCRWFAGFALIERIGIRKRYRSYQVLAALARAALELCRQKGYRLVAGRARTQTVAFWRRLGGRQSGPAITMFRGTLVPIIHEIPERPDLGAVPCGPFGDANFENLIVQQEGYWDFRPFTGQLLAAE